MSVSLVTVGEVREFIQKPTPDTNQDPIIAELIKRASETVINYAEREFAPAGTTTAVRSFVYCGNGVLNLAPDDLQKGTVVSVKIDTVDGTGGTALTAGTHYTLRPTRAKDGVQNWMRLAASLPAANPSPYFEDREVTIDAKWGFPSVPDDVKHWTIVTVAEWLRLHVSAFTTVFNIDEARLERPEALPSAVRAGLGKYKTPR